MHKQTIDAIKKLCLPGRPITFLQLKNAGATNILTHINKLQSAGHHFAITTLSNNWMASIVIKLDKKEIL